MSRKRHLVVIAGLLGLSCVVQAVVVRRAAVTALDAVRFVSTAQSIDGHGFRATVRTEQEQPLFPAWVWVVHEVLTWSGGESRSAWATSAQLAAASALVLAVVPLYLLAARLVGPAAAIAAAVFFCLLPEVSRLGADAISDSTHLLFFCLAFWAIVEYWERWEAKRDTGAATGGRRAGIWLNGWLCLAGVAAAAAALARAEVLVLAGAFVLTLVVFQLRAGRRRAWASVAAGIGAFGLGLAVVLGPYLVAAHALVPQAAVARAFGRHHAQRPTGEEESRLVEKARGDPIHRGEPGAAGRRAHEGGEYEPLVSNVEGAAGPHWRLAGGEPASFDLKEPTVSARRRGCVTALVQFGRKLADAFSYWIGGLALFGAWRRSRQAASAADRFVQIFFVLFCLAAIRFAATEGYLAPRHLIPLVVAGIGSAGHGALEIGRRLRNWRGLGRQVVSQPGEAARAGTHGLRMAWLVVGLAAIACLPQTFMRLHFSRLGHRAAGEWLGTQAELPGAVLDTHGWTGLYSGRKTYRYDEARAALSDPQLAYVVLDRREFDYASARSRTLRWLIEAAARPAAEFPHPATRRPTQQPVLVCRWYPDRFDRQVAARAKTHAAALIRGQQR